MQKVEILSIISCIKSACISIYRSLEDTIQSETNITTNASGDKQSNLDILANNIFKSYLLTNSNIKYITSGEDPDSIPVNSNGKYIVVFDPLDGSGNIPEELSLGSIFAIFKDNPKNGRDILFAGYCLYTYKCLMIYTFGDYKVYKDYILDLPVKIPVSCKYLIKSIYRGNKYCCINNKFRDTQILFNDVKNYRWTGCMVSDIHRIIVNTGYFCYPQSKLRLLYECYPMAFIISNLGGKSIRIDHNSGYSLQEDILDLPFPEQNIHQKIGILIENPGKIIAKI